MFGSGVREGTRVAPLGGLFPTVAFGCLADIVGVRLGSPLAVIGLASAGGASLWFFVCSEYRLHLVPTEVLLD